MYVNYDLAKALLDDRRTQARRLRRQRIRPEPGPPADLRPADDAEVIELVFGRHCDTGQIGA